MLMLDQVRAKLGAFEFQANFTIPEGAKVAIIGPSGSGKSTFLNIVAGFQELSAGRLRINGQDMTKLGPGERPLSIIFQDSNLFPHLTVAQNVGLGIDPALRLNAAETKDVEAALEQVGLSGFGARKPAALSGGQQSRVALARVLLRKRPLLLLDEPFAALGPALRQEMLELVAGIAEEQNLTVLMVTHEPTDAQQLAELSIFVDDGIAHPPTDTNALLCNPPEALKAYLGT